MFDGYRPGDGRFRHSGIGDRVAAGFMSFFSLEGIVNLTVALAIILILLNYVIIPQARKLGENMQTRTMPLDTPQ